MCPLTSLPVVSGVEDGPGLGHQVYGVAALAGQDLPGEERAGDEDRPDPADHLSSDSSASNHHHLHQQAKYAHRNTGPSPPCHFSENLTGLV